MSHKYAALLHVRKRMMQRYKRRPERSEIDNMRISLKRKTCFLYKEYENSIIGIVRFKNIHVTAVYNKSLDSVVTVGSPIPK